MIFFGCAQFDRQAVILSPMLPSRTTRCFTYGHLSILLSLWTCFDFFNIKHNMIDVGCASRLRREHKGMTGKLTSSMGGLCFIKRPFGRPINAWYHCHRSNKEGKSNKSSPRKNEVG